MYIISYLGYVSQGVDEHMINVHDYYLCVCVVGGEGNKSGIMLVHVQLHCFSPV